MYGIVTEESLGEDPAALNANGGTLDVNPLLKAKYIEPDKPEEQELPDITRWDAAKAGFYNNSLTSLLYRRFEKPNFESVSGYDAQAKLAQIEKARGVQMSEDKREWFIKNTQSDEEATWNLEQIQERLQTNKIVWVVSNYKVIMPKPSPTWKRKRHLTSILNPAENKFC